MAAHPEFRLVSAAYVMEFDDACLLAQTFFPTDSRAWGYRLVDSWWTSPRVVGRASGGMIAYRRQRGCLDVPGQGGPTGGA